MSHLKKLKRLLASIVVVTFFTTNTITPSAGAYASGEVFGRGSQISQRVYRPSGSETDFKIPAELGKVTDVIRSPFPESQLLIHIQEAHANYDAQQNIKKILEYLAKNYATKLILLEGAGYKLDPSIFNLFPNDPALQDQVNSKLIGSGEMTGAEAFLINAGPRAMGHGPRTAKGEPWIVGRGSWNAPEAWGVESAKEYREGREAYRAVYNGRGVTNSFLGAFFRQWQKTADRKLSKPLRGFLNREIDFHEGRLPLQDWLLFLKTAAARELKVDLEDVREQMDWPVLTRYFRLKKIDSQIDPAKARKEQAAFLTDLRTRKVSEPLIKEISGLFKHKAATDLPVYKTRFAFERLMDALPADYSFEPYPVFRLHLQQIILLSEIQSDMLQREIGALSMRILKTSVKTPQEQKMVDILRNYGLLKKLLSLELDRAGFEQLKVSGTNPEKIASELGLTSSKLKKVHSLFEIAVRFYETAIKREDIMMKNAFAKMGETQQTKAVLITGGFHTAGLKKAATASGSSYIGITPNIDQIRPEDEKNYLRTLLGTRTTDHEPRKNIGPRGPWPVARGPEDADRSHQAALVRSDLRFLQEVSPQNWRNELRAAGEHVAAAVDSVSSEAGGIARRNFAVHSEARLRSPAEWKAIHAEFTEALQSLDWPYWDNHGDKHYDPVLMELWGQKTLLSISWLKNTTYPNQIALSWAGGIYAQITPEGKVMHGINNKEITWEDEILEDMIRTLREFFKAKRAGTYDDTEGQAFLKIKRSDAEAKEKERQERLAHEPKLAAERIAELSQMDDSILLLQPSMWGWISLKSAWGVQSDWLREVLRRDHGATLLEDYVKQRLRSSDMTPEHEILQEAVLLFTKALTLARADQKKALEVRQKVYQIRLDRMLGRRGNADRSVRSETRSRRSEARADRALDEYVKKTTREATVAWKIGMHGPTSATLVALFNAIRDKMPCVITLSGTRGADGSEFRVEYDLQDLSQLIDPVSFIVLGVGKNDRVKIEIETDAFVEERLVQGVADIIKDCFENEKVDFTDLDARSRNRFQTTTDRELLYETKITELFQGDKPEDAELLTEKYRDMIERKGSSTPRAEARALLKVPEAPKTEIYLSEEQGMELLKRLLLVGQEGRIVYYPSLSGQNPESRIIRVIRKSETEIVLERGQLLNLPKNSFFVVEKDGSLTFVQWTYGDGRLVEEATQGMPRLDNIGIFFSADNSRPVKRRAGRAEVRETGLAGPIGLISHMICGFTQRSEARAEAGKTDLPAVVSTKSEIKDREFQSIDEFMQFLQSSENTIFPRDLENSAYVLWKYPGGEEFVFGLSKNQMSVTYPFFMKVSPAKKIDWQLGWDFFDYRSGKRSNRDFSVMAGNVDKWKYQSLRIFNFTAGPRIVLKRQEKGGKAAFSIELRFGIHPLEGLEFSDYVGGIRWQKSMPSDLQQAGSMSADLSNLLKIESPDGHELSLMLYPYDPLEKKPEGQPIGSKAAKALPPITVGPVAETALATESPEGTRSEARAELLENASIQHAFRQLGRFERNHMWVEKFLAMSQTDTLAREIFAEVDRMSEKDLMREAHMLLWTTPTKENNRYGIGDYWTRQNDWTVKRWLVQPFGGLGLSQLIIRDINWCFPGEEGSRKSFPNEQSLRNNIRSMYLVLRAVAVLSKSDTVLISGQDVPWLFELIWSKATNDLEAREAVRNLLLLEKLLLPADTANKQESLKNLLILIQQVRAAIPLCEKEFASPENAAAFSRLQSYVRSEVKDEDEEELTPEEKAAKDLARVKSLDVFFGAPARSETRGDVGPIPMIKIALAAGVAGMLSVGCSATSFVTSPTRAALLEQGAGAVTDTILDESRAADERIAALNAFLNDAEAFRQDRKGGNRLRLTLLRAFYTLEHSSIQDPKVKEAVQNGLARAGRSEARLRDAKQQALAAGVHFLPSDNADDIFRRIEEARKRQARLGDAKQQALAAGVHFLPSDNADDIFRRIEEARKRQARLQDAKQQAFAAGVHFLPSDNADDIFRRIEEARKRQARLQDAKQQAFAAGVHFLPSDNADDIFRRIEEARKRQARLQDAKQQARAGDEGIVGLSRGGRNEGDGSRFSREAIDATDVSPLSASFDGRSEARVETGTVNIEKEMAAKILGMKDLALQKSVQERWKDFATALNGPFNFSSLTLPSLSTLVNLYAKDEAFWAQRQTEYFSGKFYAWAFGLWGFPALFMLVHYVVSDPPARFLSFGVLAVSAGMFSFYFARYLGHFINAKQKERAAGEMQRLLGEILDEYSSQNGEDRAKKTERSELRQAQEIIFKETPAAGRAESRLRQTAPDGSVLRRRSEARADVEAVLDAIDRVSRSHWGMGQWIDLKRALWANNFAEASRIAQGLERYRSPDDPWVGHVIDGVKRLRSEVRSEEIKGNPALIELAQRFLAPSGAVDWKALQDFIGMLDRLSEIPSDPAKPKITKKQLGKLREDLKGEMQKKRKKGEATELPLNDSRLAPLIQAAQAMDQIVKAPVQEESAAAPDVESLQYFLRITRMIIDGAPKERVRTDLAINFVNALADPDFLGIIREMMGSHPELGADIKEVTETALIVQTRLQILFLAARKIPPFARLAKAIESILAQKIETAGAKPAAQEESSGTQDREAAQKLLEFLEGLANRSGPLTVGDVMRLIEMFELHKDSQHIFSLLRFVGGSVEAFQRVKASYQNQRPKTKLDDTRQRGFRQMARMMAEALRQEFGFEPPTEAVPPKAGVAEPVPPVQEKPADEKAAEPARTPESAPAEDLSTVTPATGPPMAVPSDSAAPSALPQEPVLTPVTDPGKEQPVATPLSREPSAPISPGISQTETVSEEALVRNLRDKARDFAHWILEWTGSPTRKESEKLIGLAIKIPVLVILRKIYNEPEALRTWEEKWKALFEAAKEALSQDVNLTEWEEHLMAHIQGQTLYDKALAVTQLKEYGDCESAEELDEIYGLVTSEGSHDEFSQAVINAKKEKGARRSEIRGINQGIVNRVDGIETQLSTKPYTLNPKEVRSELRTQGSKVADLLNFYEERGSTGHEIAVVFYEFLAQNRITLEDDLEGAAARLIYFVLLNETRSEAEKEKACQLIGYLGITGVRIAERALALFRNKSAEEKAGISALIHKAYDKANAEEQAFLRETFPQPEPQTWLDQLRDRWDRWTGGRSEARTAIPRSRYKAEQDEMARLQLAYRELVRIAIDLLGLPAGQSTAELLNRLNALKDTSLSLIADAVLWEEGMETRRQAKQTAEEALRDLQASGVPASVEKLIDAAQFLLREYQRMQKVQHDRIYDSNQKRRNKIKFLETPQGQDAVIIDKGVFGMHPVDGGKVPMSTKKGVPMRTTWEGFRSQDHTMDSEFGYLDEVREVIAELGLAEAEWRTLTQTEQGQFRPSARFIERLQNEVLTKLARMAEQTSGALWILDIQLAEKSLNAAIGKAAEGTSERTLALKLIELARSLVMIRYADIQSKIEGVHGGRLTELRFKRMTRNIAFRKLLERVQTGVRQGDHRYVSQNLARLSEKVQGTREPDLIEFAKIIEAFPAAYQAAVAIERSFRRQPDQTLSQNDSAVLERVPEYLRQGFHRLDVANKIHFFMAQYRDSLMAVRVGEVVENPAQTLENIFRDTYLAFLRTHQIPAQSRKAYEWWQRLYQVAFVSNRIQMKLPGAKKKTRVDNPVFQALHLLAEVFSGETPLDETPENAVRLEKYAVSAVTTPKLYEFLQTIPAERRFLYGQPGRVLTPEERDRLLLAIAEDFHIDAGELRKPWDLHRGLITARAARSETRDEEAPENVPFPSFTLLDWAANIFELARVLVSITAPWAAAGFALGTWGNHLEGFTAIPLFSVIVGSVAIGYGIFFGVYHSLGYLGTKMFGTRYSAAITSGETRVPPGTTPGVGSGSSRSDLRAPAKRPVAAAALALHFDVSFSNHQGLVPNLVSIYRNKEQVGSFEILPETPKVGKRTYFIALTDAVYRGPILRAAQIEVEIDNQGILQKVGDVRVNLSNRPNERETAKNFEEIQGAFKEFLKAQIGKPWDIELFRPSRSNERSEIRTETSIDEARVRAETRQEKLRQRIVDHIPQGVFLRFNDAVAMDLIVFWGVSLYADAYFKEHLAAAGEGWFARQRIKEIFDGQTGKVLTSAEVAERARASSQAQAIVLSLMPQGRDDNTARESFLVFIDDVAVSNRSEVRDEDDRMAGEEAPRGWTEVKRLLTVTNVDQAAAAVVKTLQRIARGKALKYDSIFIHFDKGLPLSSEEVTGKLIRISIEGVSSISAAYVKEVLPLQNGDQILITHVAGKESIEVERIAARADLRISSNASIISGVAALAALVVLVIYDHLRYGPEKRELAAKLKKAGFSPGDFDFQHTKMRELFEAIRDGAQKNIVYDISPNRITEIDQEGRRRKIVEAVIFYPKNVRSEMRQGTTLEARDVVRYTGTDRRFFGRYGVMIEAFSGFVRVRFSDKSGDTVMWTQQEARQVLKLVARKGAQVRYAGKRQRSQRENGIITEIVDSFSETGELILDVWVNFGDGLDEDVPLDPRVIERQYALDLSRAEVRDRPSGIEVREEGGKVYVQGPLVRFFYRNDSPGSLAQALNDNLRGEGQFERAWEDNGLVKVRFSDGSMMTVRTDSLQRFLERFFSEKPGARSEVRKPIALKLSRTQGTGDGSGLLQRLSLSSDEGDVELALDPEASNPGHGSYSYKIYFNYSFMGNISLTLDQNRVLRKYGRVEIEPVIARMSQAQNISHEVVGFWLRQKEEFVDFAKALEGFLEGRLGQPWNTRNPDFSAARSESRLAPANELAARLTLVDSPLQTILIVEDQKSQRTVMQKLFADEGIFPQGFRVVTAANGREALDKIRELAERKIPVGLVITDNHMPVMSGEELIRQLRGLDNRVPVILFSGVDFKNAQNFENVAGLTKGVANTFILEEVVQILAARSEQRVDRKAPEDKSPVESIPSRLAEQLLTNLASIASGKVLKSGHRAQDLLHIFITPKGFAYRSKGKGADIALDLQGAQELYQYISPDVFLAFDPSVVVAETYRQDLRDVLRLLPAAIAHLKPGVVLAAGQVYVEPTTISSGGVKTLAVSAAPHFLMEKKQLRSEARAEKATPENVLGLTEMELYGEDMTFRLRNPRSWRWDRSIYLALYDVGFKRGETGEFRELGVLRFHVRAPSRTQPHVLVWDVFPINDAQADPTIPAELKRQALKELDFLTDDLETLGRDTSSQEARSEARAGEVEKWLRQLEAVMVAEKDGRQDANLMDVPVYAAAFSLAEQLRELVRNGRAPWRNLEQKVVRFLNDPAHQALFVEWSSLTRAVYDIRESSLGKYPNGALSDLGEEAELLIEDLQWDYSRKAPLRPDRRLDRQLVQKTRAFIEKNRARSESREGEVSLRAEGEAISEIATLPSVARNDANANPKTEPSVARLAPKTVIKDPEQALRYYMDAVLYGYVYENNAKKLPSVNEVSGFLARVHSVKIQLSEGQSLRAKALNTVKEALKNPEFTVAARQLVEDVRKNSGAIIPLRDLALQILSDTITPSAEVEEGQSRSEMRLQETLSAFLIQLHSLQDKLVIFTELARQDEVDALNDAVIRIAAPVENFLDQLRTGKDVAAQVPAMVRRLGEFLSEWEALSAEDTRLSDADRQNITEGIILARNDLMDAAASGGIKFRFRSETREASAKEMAQALKDLAVQLKQNQKRNDAGAVHDMLNVPRVREALSFLGEEKDAVWSKIGFWDSLTSEGSRTPAEWAYFLIGGHHTNPLSFFVNLSRDEFISYIEKAMKAFELYRQIKPLDRTAAIGYEIQLPFAPAPERLDEMLQEMKEIVKAKRSETRLQQTTDHGQQTTADRQQSTAGVSSLELVPPQVVPLPALGTENEVRGKDMEFDTPYAVRGTQLPTTATPVVTITNIDRLINENVRLGGGTLQGFRGVTEKITDGIISLTAHTLNAAELVLSTIMPKAFAQEPFSMVSRPETFLERARFAAALRTLGVKTPDAGSDIFVLGPEFAFDQGAIAAMRTVFGDVPVIVLVRNAADRGFLETLNIQFRQANRPPILPAGHLDEVRKLLDQEAASLRARGARKVQLKAMVYVAESLPEALVKQLSDITVVNARMFKNFLNLAGDRIGSLVAEVQAQFALARSA